MVEWTYINKLSSKRGKGHKKKEYTIFTPNYLIVFMNVLFLDEEGEGNRVVGKILVNGLFVTSF